MAHQRPEPGEWQEEINAFGGVRRYRMIGNCKEYEPTIRVDGIEIPQSELTAYHERKKAAQAAQIEAAKKAAAATPPPRNCPFSDGMSTQCTREKCALYLNGCTLARLTDRPPAKATEGLQCPFSKYHYTKEASTQNGDLPKPHKCRKDCALFNNTGCTFTGIKESEDK